MRWYTYMPPPPRAMNAKFDGTIHLVRKGFTLCGTPTCEMKASHHWVELKGFDAHEANCKGCLAEKEYRDLLARGIKAKRPPKPAKDD